MKDNGHEVKGKAPDYLQWIGAVHYPDVDDFIKEARTQGISKRIGKLPIDLVLGESRIFLAHDDGLVGDGFVFGYYIPSALEYLAEKESHIPPDVYDKATWVSEWRTEQERGCGFRDEGMYLVTEPQQGELVIFDEPRILARFSTDEIKRFRGLLEIEFGDLLINAGDLAPSDKKRYVMTPPSRIDWPLRDVPDEELIQRMEEGPSMSRVAREIALETNDKKSSVLYRYKQLLAELEAEEGQDSDE